MISLLFHKKDLLFKAGGLSINCMLAVAVGADVMDAAKGCLEDRRVVHFVRNGKWLERWTARGND